MILFRIGVARSGDDHYPLSFLNSLSRVVRRPPENHQLGKSRLAVTYEPRCTSIIRCDGNGRRVFVSRDANALLPCGGNLKRATLVVHPSQVSRQLVTAAAARGDL
jgi:hypothetical protein